MKKAKPSAENGSPMMLPLNAIKPGQRSPSSNDSAVPETAPIAKISAKDFDQRRASASQTGSCRQTPIPSAANISRGMPTPSTAKTMWNPSEVPMIARERVTLSTVALQHAGFDQPLASLIFPPWRQSPSPARGGGSGCGLSYLGGRMLQQHQGQR